MCIWLRRADRRFCLPNTRFLIHQPSGGIGGKASDIAIQAQEIVRARQRIAELIARETGKPLATILKDIERDHWLSATEAVEYGLVGRIIERRDSLQGEPLQQVTAPVDADGLSRDISGRF